MDVRRENLNAEEVLVESDRVQEAATMSAKNRRQRRRMKLFGGAAAIVVFITTYMLILPAITLEHKPTCGLEEHTHTEACYTAESALSCGQEESAGHTHSEACYQTEQLLVCGQEEGEEHIHSDVCYETIQTLVCGQEESAGHTHTDACYTEKSELTCTLSEHTHTDACYPSEEKAAEESAAEDSAESEEALPSGDSTADLESAADWEATLAGITLSGNWGKDVVTIAKSQLGYCESTANFISYRDETDKVVTKGYSRYGAWYGSPYGDWCAMFCSFCYHYADIPESAMPEHSGVPAWITLLNSRGQYHSASSGYVPKAGDLIFYDWESDGCSDHVALVEEYRDGTVYTIEGNFNDMVAQCSYQYGDYRIAGYGELPENPDAVPQVFSLTAEADDGVSVTVSGKTAVLGCDPDEVTLTVVRMSEEETAKLAAEVKLNSREKTNVAYDITLWHDGEELEPTGAVSVVVSGYAVPEGEDLTVYHFAGEEQTPELIPVESGEDESLTMEFDSFSPVLLSTGGTTTSSNLADFVTGVTMKDAAGNEITSESIVYIGENYTISMTFAESNVINNEKQFVYDGNGYLTYQLDTSKLNLVAVDNKPIYSQTNPDKVIGHYSLTTAGVLTVRMDEVDAAGNSTTGTNFIDNYRNATLQLDFEASINASSDETNWSYPFSEDITINPTISKDSLLKVKKAAGAYDAAARTLHYDAAVWCAGGIVNGPFTYEDTQVIIWDNVSHDDWAPIDETSIKYYVLTFDSNGQPSGKGAELDGPPDSLRNGEGYVMSYDLKFSEELYKAIDASDNGTDNGVASSPVVTNTLTVKGGTPEKPISGTDTVDKRFYISRMNKSYSLVKATDTSNNTVDVIAWRVVVGNGSDTLGDNIVFKDYLGEGYQYFTDEKYDTTNPATKPGFTVKVLEKEDGKWHTYKYYYDQTEDPHVTLSASDAAELPGTMASFTLPAGLQYDITYYTTVETGKADSAYVNAAIAKIFNRDVTVVKPGPSSIGVPGVSKVVDHTDDTHIYYTAEISMPGTLYGEYVYLQDIMTINSKRVSQEFLEIQSVTVTTASQGEVTYTEYSGSGPTQNTYLIAKNPNNSLEFQMVFNAARSEVTGQGAKWIIEENSTITISYRIPYDALLADGSAMRQKLGLGYVLTNELRVVHNGQNTSKQCKYYERAQTIKYGYQDEGVPYMYYRMYFYNQKTTNTSTGARTSVLPADFNNAYLEDNFDPQLSLVQETPIYATIYNISDNKLVAEFAASVSDIEMTGNNTFRIYWDKFNERTYGTVNPDKTNLLSFMQAGYNQYYIAFGYYMDAPSMTLSGQQSITVTNTAKIGFTADPSTNPTQVETTPASTTKEFKNYVLYKMGEQLDDGGKEIGYTIVVNYWGKDLTNGESIQVVDQMGSNLMPYLDSIVFLNPHTDAAIESPCSYTYDQYNNTITFTVPDDEPIIISYTVRINTETSGSVTVNNVASIKGFNSYTAGGDIIFDVNNTSGSGTGSNEYVIIQKQHSDTNQPLNGVTFDLYGPKDATKQETVPNGADATIQVGGTTLYYYTTYTTAALDNLEGAFTIPDTKLADGGTYALKERNALPGFKLLDAPVVFTWNASNVDGNIRNLTHRETLTIPNEPYTYALPSTGGAGTRRFTIAGLALMAAAFVIGLSTRRKRERRTEF